MLGDAAKRPERGLVLAGEILRKRTSWDFKALSYLGLAELAELGLAKLAELSLDRSAELVRGGHSSAFAYTERFVKACVRIYETVVGLP